MSEYILIERLPVNTLFYFQGVLMRIVALGSEDPYKMVEATCVGGNKFELHGAMHVIPVSTSKKVEILRRIKLETQRMIAANDRHMCVAVCDQIGITKREGGTWALRDLLNVCLLYTEILSTRTINVV